MGGEKWVRPGYGPLVSQLLRRHAETLDIASVPFSV